MQNWAGGFSRWGAQAIPIGFGSMRANLLRSLQCGVNSHCNPGLNPPIALMLAGLRCTRKQAGSYDRRAHTPLELGETPSAKSAAGASKEAPANSPIVANRRRETPLDSVCFMMSHLSRRKQKSLCYRDSLASQQSARSFKDQIRIRHARRPNDASKAVPVLDPRLGAAQFNASGTGGRCSPSPLRAYGMQIRSLRSSSDRPRTCSLGHRS